MDTDRPDGIIRGAVRLPGDSDLIVDADEEVFLLYSNLQSKPGAGPDTDSFRGLGHVDSRKDTLTIKFELTPDPSQNAVLGSEAPDGSPILKGSRRSRKKATMAKNGKGRNTSAGKTIEIELVQDKTALRTRKGDTGSVLWKASIDFSHLILQQLYFPDSSTEGLLNPNDLVTAHVLELGAGTGLIAAALSPFVEHYTVTDISTLLPLLHKNITLSFPPPSKPNITISELDWVLLYTLLPPQRARYTRDLTLRPIDVLLIVDCIYHPSLLPALVTTIDFLAVPGRTAVLVVVELRAEDVVREFLGLWLALPGWEVWHVGGSGMGIPYVMWLGWKTEMRDGSTTDVNHQ